MQYWTDGQVPAPGFDVGLEIRADHAWRVLTKVPARDLPPPMPTAQRPRMWAEDSDGSVVFWPHPDHPYLVRTVELQHVAQMSTNWKGMAGPGSGEGVAAFAQRLNDSANKAAAKDAQDRGLPKPIPIVVKPEEPRKLPLPTIDVVLINATAYELKPEVTYCDGRWTCSIDRTDSVLSPWTHRADSLRELIEWLDGQVNEAIQRNRTTEEKVDHRSLLEQLERGAEIPSGLNLSFHQIAYIIAHLQKMELPNAPS